MLQDCNLAKNTVSNMRTGSMPSADKLIIIADYLEVSAEYLMGLTDDPTPPKKSLTREEKLMSEIFKLDNKEFNDLERYVKFLKEEKQSETELIDKLDRLSRKPKLE